MNKSRIKTAVWQYQIKVTALIVEGVINRANKSTVLQQCRKEVVNFPLSNAEKEKLWNWVLDLYNKIVRSAKRSTDPKERSERIYSVLRSETDEFEKMKNTISDEVEYRVKRKELVKLLADPVHKFYYCTVHANPAEGHAMYQGKIYYREQYWDQFTEKEKEFVESHNLLSVEEVVMGPIWLCTRRNCKHRLVPVDKNTRRIEADDMSYEEQQYRYYYDRLKLLNRLKKKGLKSKKMKDDILRTRGLVKKWYRAWKEKEKEKEAA